jgi:phospholipase/carboxylesterase
MALQKIVLDPKTKPLFSIIILHGLGADGYDFHDVAIQLQQTLPQPTRFVLPHAKRWPVTINGGMSMPAWYDMKSLDHPRDIGWNSFDDSSEEIQKLIQEQIDDGISAEKIILAGFSQGGVMAIHCARNFPKKIKGIIALSTYLVEKPEIEIPSENKKIPIFMAHGNSDPIIPIEIGKKSADTLKSDGHPITWKQYPMPHSLCMEEIQDILNWIKNIMD